MDPIGGSKTPLASSVLSSAAKPMASPPSLRKWARQTTKTTMAAAAPPQVSVSASSFNSSIFFPFRFKTNRTTHLTAFNSSSCLCHHSTNNIDRAKIRARKSSAAPFASKNASNYQDRVKSRNNSALLRFKSLFGRRALWRRILCASTRVRSLILLNVITVIYASDIPVVKEVEAIVDPHTFTVVRFVTSAIPFVPYLLQAQDDVQTRNAGIELGFWVSLGYLMQALGLLTSDAGRASFLSMFTVIVVPLLDSLLGAIVPPRTWFGAVMSILGVAMLESSGSPPSVGDLLNFLSAVFFGIHMLRTEQISRNTPKENFLPLLGYEVCVVALLSTLWYFIEGWSTGSQAFDPSSWTWTMFWEWAVAFPWIPALYTGIFSTGLCLWIEMAAMRDVSATETAIIYGLEPVWGAGFAWFLLGERWGLCGWIGAALVLGGSLTVQLSGLFPNSSREGEESFKKGNDMLISDNHNGMSAAPIIVSSRKDAADYLKK